MMNNFINFCKSGYLFKCKPHEFDKTVQQIFIDIFTSQYTTIDHIKLANMIGHPNIKKCIICSRYIGTEMFTICKCCVKKCIGINIDLRFATYISFSNSGCNFSYDMVELLNETFGHVPEPTICNIIKKFTSNHCWGCTTYIKLNNIDCQIICNTYKIICQDISYVFHLYPFVNGSKKYGIKYYYATYIENEFIKYAPKLYDEYYHTSSILFIMALDDISSPIHILTHDIVTYILWFIYLKRT